MPQITLYAPNITCDHCIATIRAQAEATPGTRFISGDPNARAFVVDLADGAALDRLGVALAEAGYPLGDAAAARAAAAGEHDARAGADWRPAYRVTRTPAGADVNYACYCGCEAGFALDRAQPNPAPEGCCCGNRILVGRDAAERLAATLDAPATYRVDVQPVTMPWGQPMEVALAVPRDDGQG
ncbi:MAG: heavy-metal-associated domain-containing protein [Chloroflexi bacterium]|nr:heavy-metal-associated domain-containing protein [Chloroflexota bacterium]